MRGGAGDPETPAEWQDAVDMASTLLLLDSARQYGLVRGGPEANVARCVWVLAEGQRRGLLPHPNAVERFVRQTLEHSSLRPRTDA